jgi:hypothetical protein
MTFTSLHRSFEKDGSPRLSILLHPTRRRRAPSLCGLEFGRFQSVARSGQNSLAQGLPGLVKNKRFALKLKELETRTRSGSKVPSRLSPYLMAPSASGTAKIGPEPLAGSSAHLAPSASGLNVYFCLTQRKP